MPVAEHDTYIQLLMQMLHFQAIISMNGYFLIRLAVETFEQLLEDKNYHSAQIKMIWFRLLSPVPTEDIIML